MWAELYDTSGVAQRKLLSDGWNGSQCSGVFEHGIAWQPGFLSKTVLRVGAGVFKERLQGNVAFDAVNFPPTRRDSTLQYGKVTDITAAMYNIISPPSPQGGYAGTGKVPKTIQWNFAVERELPYATLLSVG